MIFPCMEECPLAPSSTGDGTLHIRSLPLYIFDDDIILTFTPLKQHIAATSSSLTILRDFLSQGASVHLRNHDGHTPLYLAADAGKLDNVKLLRESGAHLHAEEIEFATLLKGRLEAGSGCVTPAEFEVDGTSGGRATLSRPGSSGSGASGVIEEKRRRKAKCWDLAGV